MERQQKFTLASLVIVLSIFIAWAYWFSHYGLPPQMSDTTELQKKQQYLNEMILLFGGAARFWTQLNIILQLLIIILGIIGTLMVALQNEDNKKWMKPLGIVTTTLVTGITGGMSTFHVRDHVEESIELQDAMINLANSFDEEIVGKSDDQIKAIMKKYDNEFEKIAIRREYSIAQVGTKKTDAEKK